MAKFKIGDRVCLPEGVGIVYKVPRNSALQKYAIRLIDGGQEVRPWEDDISPHSPYELARLGSALRDIENGCFEPETVSVQGPAAGCLEGRVR